VPIEAVDAACAEAQQLISELDRYLLEQYPGQPTNGIDADEFRAAGGYFVLLRERAGDEAVACGAFRPVTPHSVEMKRLFVRPQARRRGHARRILVHLEQVALERGYLGAVLETGTSQPESIALYEAAGYFRIPRYEQFVTSPDSVCFAKRLGAEAKR